MSNAFESQLRDALDSATPEPARFESAIDAGLKHRRARRSILVLGSIGCAGLAGLILVAVVNAPPAQNEPQAPVLQPVLHRVEAPIFAQADTDADRSASWTILSIEGASTP